jgi:hypothetical protein
MKKDQTKEVTAFLERLLPIGAEVPARVIEERAAARGFSKWQVKRARRKMDIAVFKENGAIPGRWFCVRGPGLTYTGEK